MTAVPETPEDEEGEDDTIREDEGGSRSPVFNRHLFETDSGEESPPFYQPPPKAAKPKKPVKKPSDLFASPEPNEKKGPGFRLPSKAKSKASSMFGSPDTDLEAEETLKVKGRRRKGGKGLAKPLMTLKKRWHCHLKEPLPQQEFLSPWITWICSGPETTTRSWAVQRLRRRSRLPQPIPVRTLFKAARPQPGGVRGWGGSG